MGGRVAGSERTWQFPGGWGSDPGHSPARRRGRSGRSGLHRHCWERAGWEGRPAPPPPAAARGVPGPRGHSSQPPGEGHTGEGGAPGGGVARRLEAKAAPGGRRGGGGRGREGRSERRPQLQQDGPPTARGPAPGTSRGGRARHPLPGRLRPGEAAHARRNQQHEQRLQQPGGGRRGLLLHRQDLLFQESAPGQAPRRPASEWHARRAPQPAPIAPGIPDSTCISGARRACPRGRRRGGGREGASAFWDPGVVPGGRARGRAGVRGGSRREVRRWKGGRPRARSCLPRQMASAALLRAAGCGTALLRAWRRPRPLPAFPLRPGSRWSGSWLQPPLGVGSVGSEPPSGLGAVVIARGGVGDLASTTFRVQHLGGGGGDDSRRSLDLGCGSQGCAFPAKSSL